MAFAKAAVLLFGSMVFPSVTLRVGKTVAAVLAVLALIACGYEYTISLAERVPDHTPNSD